MSPLLRKISTFGIAMLASASAHAIQFDGFFTVGAAIHDDDTNSASGSENRYIGSLGDRGITEDLTFETDTRFGLQISSEVSESMKVVAQLLGRGTNSNFDAIVEWAYADWEFTDWLSLRAGKIKQPVYLVNDYVEVGFAYPWIRPPVEVYYLNNPLNTVNGAELLLAFPVGPGTLSFQPYIGSNRDDIPNTGGAAFFEAENIYGIDVKYSGRGYTVHASNFKCDVKTFGNLTDVPTMFGFPVDVDLNGTGECDVTSAGLTFDVANVVVYAEWQERTTTDTLSRPFGDQDAWYATLGYRIGKWLPHLTYATIDGTASTVTPGAVECGASTGDPTATPPTGTGCVLPTGSTVPGGTALFNFPIAVQTSITAGLRYEVNDSAALKFEYAVVDVENDPAELASTNNPFGFNYGLFDTDFTKLPPKDKVGIASIALDVIF
jgi:hypothetical protein